MQQENQFKPGDLLTKGECQQLFEDKLGIKRTSYYQNYRPHIKFKFYGQIEADNGEIKKRIPRIPYEIAQGLINILMERPQPDDPPMEELQKFMKNVPEGMLN